MHIVYVTCEIMANNSNRGGLGAYVSNMSKIMCNHGHKVTVVLSTIKKDDTEINDERIDLIKLYVPLKKWEQYNKFSKKVGKRNKTKQNHIRFCLTNRYRSKEVAETLKRINNSNPIDIVQYCNLDNLYLYTFRKSPYVIRMSSYNFVTGKYKTKNYQDTLENEQYLYREHLQDYLLKKSKNVFSPSKNIANAIEERLKIKVKVLESPFLYDMQEIAGDRNNIKIDKKYVLFFGTLTYVKGIDVFVQIAKKLLIERDDIALVIAGRDDPKLIMENGLRPGEWIKNELLSWEDRVRVLGAVKHDFLFPLIQRAELCLLPYRYENLSNACIESMALGTIVVGTNGASFEQLIEDGKNGYLCERDNADSFYNKVVRVLDLSDKEKNKIVENARKTISRLNPDTMYVEYMKYYESIICEFKGK